MRIRNAFLLALFVIPGVVHAQLSISSTVTGMVNSISMAQPPGELNRIFFVEQRGTAVTFGTSNGRISLSKRVGSTWGARQTFATISGVTSSGNERGLLGLAFHPNFATNRKFYINMTNSAGNTEIRELTASLANPDVADTTSRLLLSIAQPFTNHNGGNIAFGPDGFLYIGMGDGGSANDPNGNALNLTSLLGKMLRINVDVDDFPSDANKNYGIPAGNPYIGVTGEDEIWAIGLRNPWKFAFDRNELNGFDSLTIADVGQDAREEVNHVRKGLANVNYGWRVLEGTRSTGLSGPSGLPAATLPIWEVGQNFAQSIAGGEIYRGWELGPDYWNQYVFADTVSSWLHNFKLTQNTSTGAAVATDGAGPFSVAPLGDPAVTFLSGISPTAVQKDNSGELWLMQPGGIAHRLVRTFPSGQVARNISGTITFNDILNSGLPLGITLNIDVIGSGSPTSDFALPVGLKSDKTYRVPVTNASSRAWIKYGTFLRRVLPFNATAGNVSAVNFSLINGDIDGDGEIGPADFDAVVSAFGTSGVIPADLDKDGEVGPSDFDIVVANFGQSEDPL